MLQKVLRGRNLLFLSLFISGVALLFFFLAPSSDLQLAETDPVVKIYYADNISFAHQAVIDAFNAKYKGQIQVIPINLPFSKFSTNERKELLARALRSKNTRVDVFAVDLIWVPRFARWAEPLDPLLSGAADSLFLSYALESCYEGTRLVALPLYLDIGMLYYRRDLLQKYYPDADSLEERLRHSITWETFLALLDRQPEASPFYLYAADNFEGLVCSFMELVLSQNPDFFCNDPLQLNMPETRKALHLLVDLVHRYGATPLEVTEFDEYKINLYALRHDALFWRGWPGITVHLRDEAELIEPLQHVGFAALPHFQGGAPVSVFGGWNLMISRHSEYKREAMTFVRFMLRKESQITMYRRAGYLPTLKQVYADSQFVQAHPEIHLYAALFKNGMHRPYRVDYTKLSDVLSYYVHQAIKKEMSVEAALNAATTLINSNKVLVR